MQTLAGIVTENVLYEEEEPDFSGLKKLGPVLGDELEDVAEETGALEESIVLTAAAFVLAVPGMLNAIFRIVQAIKDKAPPAFNLKKKDDPSAIDFLIKFTGKIDGYLDTPFRLMLKPFISDVSKRDKVAKLLKAVTLIIMSFGIDISKSPELLSTGKDLAPEFFQELLQSRAIPDLIIKVKPIISKLLK
tara:strand:- start:73 stop:642 length:570 start_codon:yes stop_codon:yes gene_type:complete